MAALPPPPPSPPSVRDFDEDASHRVPGLLKERTRSTAPRRRSPGPDQCHSASSLVGIFFASLLVFAGSLAWELRRSVDEDSLAGGDGPGDRSRYE